jgi:hypothetical protein
MPLDALDGSARAHDPKVVVQILPPPLIRKPCSGLVSENDATLVAVATIPATSLFYLVIDGEHETGAYEPVLSGAEWCVVSTT